MKIRNTNINRLHDLYSHIELDIFNLKLDITGIDRELAAYNAIADFLWEHKSCFTDEQQKEIDELFDEL